MVPLRIRLANIVWKNRNIVIEHLCSFRVEGNGSIVENTSMTRLMPGMKTNSKQLEKGGRGLRRRNGSRNIASRNHGHMRGLFILHWQKF